MKIAKKIGLGICLLSTAYAGGGFPNEYPSKMGWMVLLYALNTFMQGQTPEDQAQQPNQELATQSTQHLEEPSPNITGMALQLVEVSKKLYLAGEMTADKYNEFIRRVNAIHDNPNRDNVEYDLNTPEGKKVFQGLQRQVARQPTFVEQERMRALPLPLQQAFNQQNRMHDPLGLMVQKGMLNRDDLNHARLILTVARTATAEAIFGLHPQNYLPDTVAAQAEHEILPHTARADVHSQGAPIRQPHLVDPLAPQPENFVLDIDIGHIQAPFDLIEALAELSSGLTPYHNILRQTAIVMTTMLDEVRELIRADTEQLNEIKKWAPSKRQINELAKTLGNNNKYKKLKPEARKKRIVSQAIQQLRNQRIEEFASEIRTLQEHIEILIVMQRDLENVFFDAFRPLLDVDALLQTQRAAGPDSRILDRLGLIYIEEGLRRAGASSILELCRHLRVAIAQIDVYTRLLAHPDAESLRAHSPHSPGPLQQLESSPIVPGYVPQIPNNEIVIIVEDEPALPAQPCPTQEPEELSTDLDEIEISIQEHLAAIEFFRQKKAQQKARKAALKSRAAKPQRAHASHNPVVRATMLTPGQAGSFQVYLQRHFADTHALWNWMLRGAGYHACPQVRQTEFNQFGYQLADAVVAFLVDELGWDRSDADVFGETIRADFNKSFHYFHDEGYLPANYMQVRLGAFVWAGLFTQEVLEGMHTVDVIRKRILPHYYVKLANQPNET